MGDEQPAAAAAVEEAQGKEEEDDDDGAVIVEELGGDGSVKATSSSAAAPAAAAAAAPTASIPAEEEKGGGAGGAEADDEDGDEEIADVVEDSGTSAEMAKIEKEKQGMTVVEKLERSLLWKAEGNDYFKAGDIFKAADAYYHSILYCRDLTQNPKYYPNLGHNEDQRQKAKEVCESAFTNLSLVQGRYGKSLPRDDAEREKVLKEAEKCAGEALKLNGTSVKALYRRATARAALAEAGGVKNEEGQQILGGAKQDLLAALKEDPKNREARAELQAVQDRLKQLKREELQSEKRQFSFASTLAAIGAKEEDLLGDGSIRKLQASAGDGGRWYNEDWQRRSAGTRCVVHAKLALLSYGGSAGTESSCGAPAVGLAFVLGERDMHSGMSLAIKSMTQGEVAKFTFMPSHLEASGELVKLLPDHHGETSVWEITFVKFVTWEDLDKDGERLIKIHSEGYGKVPEMFAEVHVHWSVTGPKGDIIHSSRHTINLGAGGAGLKPVEDEDKEAPVYVFGETTWEPLTRLCGRLRQGGVGELRVRRAPALPKEGGGAGGASAAAAAQLSMMMSKVKFGSELTHCVVRAELERVIAPVAGPGDPRWEGAASLVQERFMAEQLLEQGQEPAALARLRRVAAWVEQLPTEEERAAAEPDLASARAAIGWILVCRAAPVLDLGNVTSDVLKVAQSDLAEAAAHCAWLESRSPNSAGTRLLRAKILVAEDDDFTGAHAQLLEAQRVAPDDKRVQEELRKVKMELRRVEEEKSRARVVSIRDGLKRARLNGPGEEASAAILALLQELLDTRVSWDTVMETRIGVELKECQEGCGDEAKRLCRDILGKFKDESKEQRPMW